MKKLTTKQIMDLQDSGKTLFVRWSRGPRYDKKPSRDYANGGAHAGLSAVQIGNWDESYMARRLGEYRFLRIKDEAIKPYIVEATVLGVDSDGYESIAVESVNWVGVWDEVAA